MNEDLLFDFVLAWTIFLDVLMPCLWLIYVVMTQLPLGNENS